MSTKSVEAWVCDLCGHAWWKPGEKPKRCAKCKSGRWDDAGVQRMRVDGSGKSTGDVGKDGGTQRWIREQRAKEEDVPF
jgi:hypothetical protein